MKIVMLFLFFLGLQLGWCNCATVVVDGFPEWTDPTAYIGDTIIFNHKNHYNLYIFRTQNAFNTCNFTQATPLSNPNSTTYTWHPSRLGIYYFSFYNGTTKPCQQGQKLVIKVNPHSQPASPPETPASSPENSPPESHAGGVVASSPAFPWPYQPREKSGAGQVSPGPMTTVGGISPAMSPVTGNGGTIPFINSNPAVPLPTGEVDSATVGPLPAATNFANQGVNMVGLFQGLIITLCYLIIVTI